MNAYLNEIFYSIQGEGYWIGKPNLFIRFCKCNLNCIYCDSDKSKGVSDYFNVYFENSIKKYRNPIGATELIDIISKFKANCISLTGGEPLLSYQVIDDILSLDKNFLLETNGTISEYITPKMLDKINVWAVDLKLKSSSGENTFNLHERFISKIEKAKFVNYKIVYSMNTNQDELKHYFDLVNDFYKKNKNISLTLQPESGNSNENINWLIKRKMNELTKLIEDYEFDIRILPQLHKLIEVK